MPFIIDRNIEGPNPLAPDLFFCKADFNDDGKVDDSDLNIFSFAIGETDCTWLPDLCDFDTDGDRDVDGADLAVLAAEFDRVGCQQ